MTPTVLALLGQPAGRDMDGRVWTEVLDTEPPMPIISWEKSRERRGIASGGDAEQFYRTS
ncbi:MAG: hypothetical protein WDM76_01525 [Limisphaerales bacterium]